MERMPERTASIATATTTLKLAEDQAETKKDQLHLLTNRHYEKHRAPFTRILRHHDSFNC